MVPNFAGNIDRRTSLTGHLFTFNNCAMNGKAQLSSITTLSTTEAEYTVVATAIKKTIYLKCIFNDFRVDQSFVVIHCDHQCAICLNKNQTHHKKTEHINIKLTLLDWRFQEQPLSWERFI